MMKEYKNISYKSEVILVSSYKSLDEVDLCVEESVILQELKKVMEEMGLDDCYHLGNYAEQRICLFKKDNLWEVYVAERGLGHNKELFDSCLDACIEVIKQACDNKQDVEVGKEILKRRVKVKEY